MKLAAIYNLWEGEELMPYSLKSIRDAVDIIIVVVSTLDDSLKVKRSLAFQYCQKETMIDKVILKEPRFYNKAQNQIFKRQTGLDEAKKLGATHFFFIDSDEMYISDEILKARNFIEQNKIDATVCSLYTYFKSANFRFKNVDSTCVIPFIHKLEKSAKVGNSQNRYKPYAVDFGRHINIKSKPIMLDFVIAHHFSWVRKDIKKKINAHASQSLIVKNEIEKDYEQAKEGYFVKHYNDVLIDVGNIFNIEI